MEKYEIIIIGAGIAGCGLAYNLSKECPEKRVLIIDKKEPGANAAYGYRNTTEKIVKAYNFPYEHIYAGMKVGVSDKTYFTLDREFYLIDYKKACKHLIKKSKVKFKKEEAIKVGEKNLKTNKNIYKFKILVDCSGNSFFVKKICNQQIPSRYWIANTKILDNKLRDTTHFHYQFSDSNYLGEIYPLKEKTLQGDWQYVKEMSFNLINPDEKNIYEKNIPKPKIIQENCSIIPCAPALPLVYKNIAFLGDSFGNSLTASACGVEPTLDTSLILAKSIKKENLKSYEKTWKKKYLDTYIRYLTLKEDLVKKSVLSRLIRNPPKRSELYIEFKKYPELFSKMFDGERNIEIPPEMQKKFPKIIKFIRLYNYINLKLKYAVMQH